MFTVIKGIAQYTFAYQVNGGMTFFYQVTSSNYCQALDMFLTKKPHQTSFTVTRGAIGYFKSH